jgi:predicted ATPase
MKTAQNKIKLKKITISGFKSFNSKEHTIEFGDISVLIGANGAGKSNFVSFFKMLNSIMNADSKRGIGLQTYIGQQGGAAALLNFGPKVTPQLFAKIELKKGSIESDYKFYLDIAAHEKLVFTREFFAGQNIGMINSSRKRKDLLLTGGEESALRESILAPQQNIVGLRDPDVRKIAKNILDIFQKCKVYQFHDTSSTAKIRNSSYVNDGDSLYSDGGNLAAFLYGLKGNEKNRLYYEKIVRHIKQIFPEFGDFALHPTALNDNKILLDWYEKNNAEEYKFGAYQLSDGTIRFMALAALLLQPPKNLPSVIVLDEPELGLHPSAIVELASMIKIASQHTQVVLATQSPALLDEFKPEQITVIERDPISKSSVFKRFTEDELKVWLEDYTLSEIWDKNILGGKP